MRRTSVCFALCDSRTVERYLAHLNMLPGQEVVPLGDLMPTPKEGIAELTKFHKMLARRFEEDGNKMVGVQILPPSSDVMRMLRATEPAIWPLFAKDLVAPKSVLPRSQRRIQSIEGAMGIRLCSNGPKLAPAAFCPSIVMSGSRYTYFAPHAVGLAGDRGGLVALCQGPWVDWEDHIAEVSHVVSKEGEPIRVGTPKGVFLGGVQDLIDAADVYARGLGLPLTEGHVVVVGGMHTRVPASHGTYDVNFGPYGCVQCGLS